MTSRIPTTTRTPATFRAFLFKASSLGAVLALFLVLCALLFGPCATLGCAGWTSPPPVTVAGDVTNRATPALVAIETAIGDAEVAAGRDPEKTVAPKWAPFWAAWQTWVAAQRAWAEAYANNLPGLEQAEAAARAALCKAVEVMPPEVPREVVMIAGFTCDALTATPAPTAITPVVTIRDGGSDVR